MTVERACLGAKYAVELVAREKNYFNIGIITGNMVQGRHEYACELRCLAAGVRLLTAVMRLYCGQCTDSCHVTVLRSMYRQMSCDCTVANVLTAVM